MFARAILKVSYNCTSYVPSVEQDKIIFLLATFHPPRQVEFCLVIVIPVPKLNAVVIIGKTLLSYTFRQSF